MLRTMGMVAALGVAMGGCMDSLDYGVMTAQIDINAFVMPTMLTDSERAEIVRKYDHLDPADEVPRGLLEDAMLYFDMNMPLIPKQQYFVVTDMSLFSGKDRYWLVDLMTGEVEAHKVAHGDGSDPDHDGYATMFSNVEGSHMTSLGFYLTGEIYNGTHQHSMRLDGLNKTGSVNGLANNNARTRLIVMHEAPYVDNSNTNKQGRSNGCLALDPSIEVDMVDRIFGGSLIYVAISSLAPPVGREPEPEPMDEDPAEEMPPDDMAPEEVGCSTSGGGGTGAGFVLAFGMLALRRRRR